MPEKWLTLRFATFVALLSMSGCIWSPVNGVTKENTETIALAGWAVGAGKTITIKARNTETEKLENSLETLGTAVSGSKETYIGSGLYPWSYTVPVLPRKYWAPVGLGVTSKSIGRAEIVAYQDSDQLITFTTAARTCALNKFDAGATQGSAGADCTDGKEVLLFDPSGVDVSPEITPWTVVSTKTVEGINVSVVKYTSDGYDVYGLVCAPPTGTNLPIMNYNHGGFWGLRANITPLCGYWAKRGWYTVMSAYRGGPVYVPADWKMPNGMSKVDDLILPNVASTTWTSTGNTEVSLGEVKDTLRLLSLARAQTNVNPSHVLMWGESHGGAVTLRALESGAPVNAAIALAPATDWAQIYTNCNANAGTDYLCGKIQTDGVLVTAMGGTPTQKPISYRWRSPYFFSRDLAIRKDVKIAILHGVDDLTVQVGNACKLATPAWGSDVKAWHVSSLGASITTPVTGCSGQDTYWSNTPRPTTNWPDNHYLLVYDNVDHYHLLEGTSELSKDFLKFVTSASAGWL